MKKTNKMNLASIGQGLLVNQTRDAVVQFYHDGELESVDIRIKQLPFSITDKLHARFRDGDNSVVADWIALALVDENNQTVFTAEQVLNNFTQNLAQGIFNEVSGITQLQKYAEKLGKASTAKTNSGANSSPTELVDEQ